ncbi:MAG: hypothetical protein JXB88_25395 [Spirochaetales bacterium]|nr:hypothetical protein [Spirochaetales bacterium]
MNSELAYRLKNDLEEVVKEYPARGLLFSGGLDSSILAYLKPGVKAITISLKSSPGEDREYSKKLSRFLNLDYFYKEIEIEEALEAIPGVIKMLKSFDPAIPNDLCVYFGLIQAKELGIEHIMTGDGSDELFGGYSYMQEIAGLNDYIKRIIPFLNFNSNIIGDFLHLKIHQPYIHKRITAIALATTPALKIKEEAGNIHGKWMLRKAFEKVLPKEIIWQNKRPLEIGSGMTTLREIISAKVDTEEYENAVKEGNIKFINKEHYFYYKIYMNVVGKIPTPEKHQKACPACGAGIKKQAFHCKICGNIIKDIL